jgi:hypothetical protein
LPGRSRSAPTLARDVSAFAAKGNKDIKKSLYDWTIILQREEFRTDRPPPLARAVKSYH